MMSLGFTLSGFLICMTRLYTEIYIVCLIDAFHKKGVKIVSFA